MASKGWVGFDLDGVLAKYDRWRGIDHIGEPIPKMVEKLQRYLADGVTVKIFTARAAEGQEAIIPVQKWCEKHFGRVLEVTNLKDMNMLVCYDDRIKQVVPNRGILVEDLLKSMRAES